MAYPGFVLFVDNLFEVSFFETARFTYIDFNDNEF